MFAWQFAKAQRVAERNGWTRFVSMQNQRWEPHGRTTLRFSGLPRTNWEEVPLGHGLIGGLRSAPYDHNRGG